MLRQRLLTFADASFCSSAVSSSWKRFFLAVVGVVGGGFVANTVSSAFPSTSSYNTRLLLQSSSPTTTTSSIARSFLWKTSARKQQRQQVDRTTTIVATSFHGRQQRTTTTSVALKNYSRQRFSSGSSHFLSFGRFCSTMLTNPTYLNCEAAASTTTSWEEEERPWSRSGVSSSPHDEKSNNTFYYELMKVPERMYDSNHVVFGQLCRNKDLLPRYDVYKRVGTGGTTPTTTKTALDASIPTVQEDDELIVADIQLGTKLEGHDGIVHGGILGLVCDDLMGFAYYALGDVPFAVTANLTLDYRNPVPSGSHVIVRMRCRKREGRKLYFAGQMLSPDGKKLYVDVSALMIIPKMYYNEES